MDSGQVLSLYFARRLGATKPHCSQHGESAGDTVITTGSIIVECGEDSFSDPSHFVGNGFDE